MRKKTRLPFSAFSIDDKKNANNNSHGSMSGENKIPARNNFHAYAGGEHKTAEKKKNQKSSTYQYSKFGKGPARRRAISPAPEINSKTKMKIKYRRWNKAESRIIPLGGVEEIGKNMTVLKLATISSSSMPECTFPMRKRQESTMSFPIPLTWRNAKIKFELFSITHGHLDHIGGVTGYSFAHRQPAGLFQKSFNLDDEKTPSGISRICLR